MDRSDCTEAILAAKARAGLTFADIAAKVGRHEVWGVTYRILEPLIPRLLAGEWPL